jgi:hypothetical protein
VYPALPIASDVVTPGDVVAPGAVGLEGVSTQPEMPTKNATANTPLRQESFIIDPVYEPR